MRPRIRYLGGLIAALASVLLMSCQPVSAATSQPQGITITPAFQMVSIPDGASAVPISFQITNNEPVAQSLKFSAADFSTLNDSGGLFFVGTNPTALQQRYGLAKWFSLPATGLTIAPRQTATIKASILNLASLQPGGHYGALMISINNGQSSSDQIGLHPVASSLLFVSKLSGATYSLSLGSVSFKHSLFALPRSATLAFQDSGNDHVIPRGVVTLSKSGKLIGKGIINQNSNLILPQMDRRFVVSLSPLAKASGPGVYKLKVDFRFDGISAYRSYESSFYYLPAFLMVILLVIAGGGLAAALFIFYQRRLRKN